MFIRLLLLFRRAVTINTTSSPFCLPHRTSPARNPPHHTESHTHTRFVMVVCTHTLPRSYSTALRPFLSYLPSLHEHSGGRTSRALREAMLPGATPSSYTAPSSRLLDPSSFQVRRQSVQVDDHHLCPGMALNPIYNVVDSDDEEVWAFPARLQLGRFSPHRAGRYIQTLSPI